MASTIANFTSDDARWAAVQARDPRADGTFVYGVKTTGIYGRPSASTRLPRRENVVFFEDAQQAEAAGFRASRRTVGDQTAATAQRCGHFPRCFAGRFRISHGGAKGKAARYCRRAGRAQATIHGRPPAARCRNVQGRLSPAHSPPDDLTRRATR